MTAEEHPDTQITMRSLRDHHALQMDATITQTSGSSLDPQITIRSVKELMQHFQEDNVEAIELAWKGLSVTSLNGDKTLLQNTSGKVHGSFLAIMGPSGSGKTTLMNVLACRSGGGMQSNGEMAINGLSYSLSELKMIAGYVMQDDLLNGNLTVEETLYYAAELRLPSSLTSREKQERVDEVIKKLGLEVCRNVIIGDHLRRGISGGQRKRVAVAIELLTRPRLLFLDEPTSGLDSVTAASLCGILRDIAHSGQCTVITTIHQPQTKIFQMFDELILLKSGHIVYYGPANEVTDFFAEAGYPCPNQSNPADHILDVITIQPTQEGSKEVVDDAEKKLKSMQKQVEVEIEKESTKFVNKLIHKERSSWWHQFIILLERSFKEQSRNRGLILTLLIQNVIMAILIGSSFLNIGNTQSSLLRRQPVLFFCVINQGIFSALMMINSFPKERTLVLRERAAGTYYVSAYFLAKNLAELAVQLFAPIVFSSIVYWLVGFQQDAAKFFIFTLFMILCSVASTSLALMISALARTTDMAVTVLPMVLEVSRLYGGFFLAPANLPKYFVWLDAISYVKYAYTGISLNELSGLTLNCENLAAGTQCVETGEEIIGKLGLDYTTLGGCVGALLLYICLARFIAYLGIRYIKH